MKYSAAANNNTLADSYTVTLNYGTGTAPAAGAATVGTASAAFTHTQEGLASNNAIVVIEQIITGLTVGTAYWIQPSLLASAGTASLETLHLEAYEV